MTRIHLTRFSHSTIFVSPTDKSANARSFFKKENHMIQ